MHFLERKLLYFDENFTEICIPGSNKKNSSISLDNGLAPERQQAIIWTNGGLV